MYSFATSSSCLFVLLPLSVYSLLSLRLFLFVKSDCVYNGVVYPSSHHTPVVGDPWTCYCYGDRWRNCEHTSTSHSSGGYSSGSEPPPPLHPTAVQHRELFQAKDFVFDLLGTMPSDNGNGGDIRPLTVVQLPSLAKQGLSFTLFTLDPCGINLPHVHPRATEILYLIEGEKLQTAFVEENGGGRVIENVLNRGMVTFFPQGLIHYQQNLGCKRAQYLSALNSEDPGVVTISTRLFELQREALAATFAIDKEEVYRLQQNLPSGPAEGRIDCMRRCGWEGYH